MRGMQNLFAVKLALTSLLEIASVWVYNFNFIFLYLVIMVVDIENYTDS